MENNRKDFLKNRPSAEAANRIKDVFETQKPSTRSTVTAVLIFVMSVVILLAMIAGNWMIMWIFIPVLVLLIISAAVGKRADKSNKPIMTENAPDAIFKDHKER